MSEKTLVKKLSKVMEKVKYIEKKGYNSFHKYKYATEADVNEKVREELAKVNVMMIPNMKHHETREHKNRKGQLEYIVTVDMEFRFIDGDSGEEITFNMSGSGQDSGDKGIYKAIAGAQKYALMKAFMIPTGDDPEQNQEGDDGGTSNNKPPKLITQEQTEELASLAKQYSDLHGRTVNDLYKALGISDLKTIPEGVAYEYIKKIKGWIQKAERESA
ncbi:hypothetical protein FKN04_22570 [Bacillus glycinifermentans]|uniref:ERF family protein n=1 Tax=Bacillus glycinifermentans TaxID=1664069 RepID=UPI001584156B|nr:ERF family protein [Bacillus glycinifermentans]NUJ19320.1 hypothetical protein [Bacillus glycinifermentans]